jgi:hypothetical protein
MCDGDLLDEMAAIIMLYHLGLLSYVALLCYRTWGVHDALSEHKSLTVNIVLALQTLLLSAPIIVLTRDNAIANTFAIASVVFVTNATSIGMLVGPRVYLLRRGAVVTVETMRSSAPAPSVPSKQPSSAPAPSVPSKQPSKLRSKLQPHSGTASARVLPDTS